MHYKTRTYLNEAVMVKSTGCDMNEVWSMYAIFSFWSCDSQGRDLNLGPHASQGDNKIRATHVSMQRHA